MTLTLGSQNIVQAQVGESIVYKPFNYGSNWIECPQEGKNPVDFWTSAESGIAPLTLMKWDSKSDIARFKTNVAYISDGVRVDDNNHLLITLPNGFTFSDENSKRFNVHSGLSGDPIADVVVDGRKLWLNFRNTSGQYRAFHPFELAIGQIVPFNGELTFKVEKES